MVVIPPEVVEQLTGLPTPGRQEAAFPLLTVDDEGFPHVCLLSRAELEADGGEVRAVIASRRTRANLERSGHATLVVVEGTTAHYLKLVLERSHLVDERLAAAFTVADHHADSLGIPLTPLGYLPTDNLSALERWDLSARGLAELRRQHGTA
jgi:hypothetical protein